MTASRPASATGHGSGGARSAFSRSCRCTPPAWMRWSPPTPSPPAACAMPDRNGRRRPTRRARRLSSPCETAVTTANLANEAVHLTGAFQLAGYQHVVGTLWQVGDLASTELARDFYTALTAPGRRSVIDVSRAAVALHHATRRLRDRYP